MMTVEALRSAGHSVELIYPPHIHELVTIFYGIMTADDAKVLLSQLEEEVWEPMVTEMVNAVVIHPLLKAFIKFLYRDDKSMTAILKNLGLKSCQEVLILIIIFIILVLCAFS